MLKLVQAVIRCELLEEVVAALKRSSVPRLMISRVQAVGSGADPDELKHSLELGSGYSDKVLLQFVWPGGGYRRAGRCHPGTRPYRLSG